MLNTNAVAAALVAANGVIDKLELETSIPKSDRDALAAYQTKLASAPTTKLEDQNFLRIFSEWATYRHVQ